MDKSKERFGVSLNIVPVFGVDPAPRHSVQPEQSGTRWCQRGSKRGLACPAVERHGMPPHGQPAEHWAGCLAYEVVPVLSPPEGPPFLGAVGGERRGRDVGRAGVHCRRGTRWSAWAGEGSVGKERCSGQVGR